MKHLTLSLINKTIRERYGASEILVKGNGYFYFTEGKAGGWESSSVYVYHLSDYTLEEWIEEYKTLNPLLNGRH